MAWYNAGSGAGVWQNAALNPSLKNIAHQLCTAINEREIARATLGQPAHKKLSSITRSGSTATATIDAAYDLDNLETGDYLLIREADQSQYNGLVQVTKTSATTFTYTVSGAPATPATGTLRAYIPSTRFIYNEDGDGKHFPAVADFVGMPISRIGNGPERDCDITRSGSTATVHLPGHGFPAGGIAEISGANESEYNGYQVVTGYPSFPAVSSITRSGTVATITFAGAHGLFVDDVVLVSGCLEAPYNGVKTVASTPTTDTVTFSVSGSPSTPASGSPACRDISRFTFTVSGTPASPATGTVKCTANRHMVPVANYAGGTGTFYCYDHGFVDDDWVEIIPERSGYTDWIVYGQVSGVTTHTFQLSMSNPVTDDFEFSLTGSMFAVKLGSFRQCLRQMQDAITQLASGSGGVAGFAVDDGVYDTDHDITSVLDETSAGSPWLALTGLSRGDIDAVLTQIREALDVLRFVRFCISTIGIPGESSSRVGDDSDIEVAWDNAVAASPSTGSTNGINCTRRVEYDGSTYEIQIGEGSATYEYTTPNIGTFVAGHYTFLETTNRNGLSTVDSFDVEDHDGNVTTLSLAFLGAPLFGENTQEIDVDVADTWMTTEPTMNFTLSQPSLPGTAPLSAPAGKYASRSCVIVGSTTNGRFINELVVGTHLTYG